MNDDWQYGTHTEILERVLKNLKPGIAIEHGSGNYSTPILMEHSGEVYSIELDPKWRKKLTSIPVVSWDDLGGLSDFDFAFVDGNPKDREAFARDCFKAGIPVIIWHDSEPAGMKWYHYDKVKIPDDYEVFRWRHKDGKRKGTTLFTKVFVGYPDRWKIEDHYKA